MEMWTVAKVVLWEAASFGYTLSSLPGSTRLVVYTLPDLVDTFLI
jgi:hypothetical protein